MGIGGGICCCCAVQTMTKPRLSRISQAGQQIIVGVSRGATGLGFPSPSAEVIEGNFRADTPYLIDNSSFLVFESDAGTRLTGAFTSGCDDGYNDFDENGESAATIRVEFEESSPDLNSNLVSTVRVKHITITLPSGDEMEWEAIEPDTLTNQSRYQRIVNGVYDYICNAIVIVQDRCECRAPDNQFPDHFVIEIEDCRGKNALANPDWVDCECSDDIIIPLESSTDLCATYRLPDDEDVWCLTEAQKRAMFPVINIQCVAGANGSPESGAVGVSGQDVYRRFWQFYNQVDPPFTNTFGVPLGKYYECSEQPTEDFFFDQGVGPGLVSKDCCPDADTDGIGPSIWFRFTWRLKAVW